MEGKPIAHTFTFKYLGFYFDADNDQTNHIGQRMGQASLDLLVVASEAATGPAPADTDKAAIGDAVQRRVSELKRQSRTWVKTGPEFFLKEKAAMIWLHFKLGPTTAGSWDKLSRKIAGLNRTTAQHWVGTGQKNHKFISKWLPLVESMTLARWVNY